MEELLIFFALPISTILISIVLQKILRRPILVAITIFAIYLVVTFAAFETEFLIAAIIYTAISLITAYLTLIIHNIVCRLENNEIGLISAIEEEEINNNCTQSTECCNRKYRRR